jgi:hypothetical protein
MLKPQRAASFAAVTDGAAGEADIGWKTARQINKPVIIVSS